MALKKTIKIEKLVHSGLGLARQENGQILLVHRTLPGEEIVPEIIQRKKQFSTGYAKTIVKPHDSRITPPCPDYNQCGGCNLQHGDYPLQLQIKQDIVADLARRTFKTSDGQSSLPINKTLPSPKKNHYRQRIRLQVNEKQQLGFFRYRSHQVCPIKTCLLAEDLLNEVLDQIQNESTALKLLDNCRELELLLNPDGASVFALFHYKRKLRPADKSAAVHLVNTLPLLEAIFFKGDNYPLSAPFMSGKTSKEIRISHSLSLSTPGRDKLTLSWEVGGFSQVNLQQNRQLIELILDYCNPLMEERILDLFCGMGNFSIPLALSAGQVLGIDSQRSAIRSAKRNSLATGLSNCTFVQSQVDQYCRKLVEEQQRFDTLILDPPRQGIPDLAEAVAQLTKNIIIYISCDPATLFRDLAQLTRLGFSIKTIQPVDMFPQTHHIETVVLLERKTHS